MAIGPIMVELMEKRSIESGNISLEDDQPWSEEIRKFLFLTNSPSLKQLKTVIPQKYLWHAPQIADFYSMLSLKVHLRKKNLYCWLILHTLLRPKTPKPHLKKNDIKGGIIFTSYLLKIYFTNLLSMSISQEIAKNVFLNVKKMETSS